MNGEGRFFVSGAASPWAKVAMQWAADRAVMIGPTATTLAPQEAVTRAEAVRVFCRFIEAEEE